MVDSKKFIKDFINDVGLRNEKSEYWSLLTDLHDETVIINWLKRKDLCLSFRNLRMLFTKLLKSKIRMLW
jgi:hypothetical protein